MAPSCAAVAFTRLLLLLLLLAFLPSWGTEPVLRREPSPGPAVFLSGSFISTPVVFSPTSPSIAKKERQAKAMLQRSFILPQELPKKQDKSGRAHMKLLQGLFVKETSSPQSPRTQETPHSISYSVLAGNKISSDAPGSRGPKPFRTPTRPPGLFVKETSTPWRPTTQDPYFSKSYSMLAAGKKLRKISSEILTHATGRHNKVTGTKDVTKETTLLSVLRQDKNAGKDDNRSVRTLDITLPVNLHSSDNSNKPQIDNNNIKDSREIPEAHIAVSNRPHQGLKTYSVETKYSGMQVAITSSTNEKVKPISEKPDRKMIGTSTTEDSEINHSVTDKPTGAHSRGIINTAIALLKHLSQDLHQMLLILNRVLPKNQDKSEIAHMNVLKGDMPGKRTTEETNPVTDEPTSALSRENLNAAIALLRSFVKEVYTPSNPTTQEPYFSKSYPMLVATKKLLEISSEILMDATRRHNKVKGAGTKEVTREATLLSIVRHEKNAGNDDERSVRRLDITLPINFHSADNSNKPQIDHLKDSGQIPEAHISVSNSPRQGLKMDSGEMKDGGMQVSIQTSMHGKVEHVAEKPDREMIGMSTAEDSETNHPVTVISTSTANEDAKDIKSLQKNEGVQDEKTADNRDVLKGFILTVVAIALAVAVIILLLINGMLYVKKKFPYDSFRDHSATFKTNSTFCSYPQELN